MCCLSESGVGLQLRHTGVYLLTFPVGMRLKVLLFGAGCCRHMILPRLRLRRVEERSCPSPTMSLQAFFIRAIQPRSPLAIRVSSSVNRPRFPIGLAAQSGTYVSQDLTESPNFLRLVSDNSDRPILPPCRHRRFLHRRLLFFFPSSRLCPAVGSCRQARVYRTYKSVPCRDVLGSRAPNEMPDTLHLQLARRQRNLVLWISRGQVCYFVVADPVCLLMRRCSRPRFGLT